MLPPFYVNALFPQEFTQEEIAKIIAHCEETFSLVIRAGEIAQSRGVTEQTIFLAFMSDLVAHATGDAVMKSASRSPVPKRE
jgi:hypothetical protein